MNRLEVLELIHDSGILAVVRLNDTCKLNSIIDALAEGGVRALEITMTTPGAVKIISELSRRLNSDFLIGAGSVLNAQATREVLDAGARFVVSPVFRQEIIEVTKTADMVCIPGAFSPTEIYEAWNAGADIVKIFPAGVLGPVYFKNIHGPLPDIRLTPTGGVNINNAADFIRAGAYCLGVGTDMIDNKLVENSDWKGLAENARQYVEAVRSGRQSLVAH